MSEQRRFGWVQRTTTPDDVAKCIFLPLAFRSHLSIETDGPSPHVALCRQDLAGGTSVRFSLTGRDVGHVMAANRRS
jgi:hypothetical protein